MASGIAHVTHANLFFQAKYSRESDIIVANIDTLTVGGERNNFLWQCLKA
jgi:hypothetical protein